MPTLQQSLQALQATDSEMDATRRRIRALQTELSDESAVAAARTALTAAEAELNAAQAAGRESEQALDKLTRTIAMLEKRLYDGSIHNAREAASVEEELQHRRGERGGAEDRVLAAMERVEAAQPTVPAARERLAAAEQTRAQRIPAIKAEGRDATALLRTLQERRAALAAATPPAVLQRYERLLATARPAVVTIHGGACGGCGVAVPTALQQQVAGGELVQCLNCRRILVDG